MPHDIEPESRAETIAKSKTGLVSGFLESTATIASSLGTIPFVGTYAKNITHVARAANKLSKMVGLGQVRTDNALQVVSVKPDFTTPLSNGCNIPTMSFDPDNAISTVPNVGGQSVDELELKYIMGTPQCILTGSFDDSSTVIAMATTARTDSASCFCDFVRSWFLYDSGSIKIKIYFTASNLHKARAVLFLADDINSDWLDCYHQVIDISGDCSTSMTLPYCNNSVSSTNGDSGGFVLYFRLLGYSQPVPTAITPIYYAVYKAAASDMDVAVYTEQQFLLESRQEDTMNPRVDFNCEFQPIHPSIKGYHHSGLCFGEKYTSIRQLMHRLQPTISFSSGATTVVTTGWTSGSTVVGPNFYNLLYRFYRGSVNFKLYTNGTSNALKSSGVIIDVGGKYVPGFMVKNSTEASIDFNVPYYSNALFEQTNVAPANPIHFTVNKSYYITKAWGDDFSMHWLKAPPPGSLQTVNSTNSKLYALQAFLIT